MSGGLILYWDTSAVISLLAEDIHTVKAMSVLRQSSVRLLSSLTIAETFAVLSRSGDGAIASKKHTLLKDISSGLWHLAHLVPHRETLASLSNVHSLRGADLWHLGLVADLKSEIGELRMITFDRNLAEAARQEDALFE